MLFSVILVAVAAIAAVMAYKIGLRDGGNCAGGEAPTIARAHKPKEPDKWDRILHNIENPQNQIDV